MQPAADDVRWRPVDPADLVQIKQSYRDAPLPLKALIRAVHSTDELTVNERADALHAIAHTTVTGDLCQWCRTLPALPHVGVCKFHSLRLFEMHA